MMQHADILDNRESMRGAFFAALALHAALLAGIVVSGWLAGHTESFGAKDAGGAIGIEAVSSIPLPHHGPPNPVANDSQSQAPETPAPPVERAKAEKAPSPKAIPLKSRIVKKKTAKVESERQRYRPFDQLDQNQVTSKQAPQVSNPLYSSTPGAGRVGANTTLGSRFAAYAAQIQQLTAQKWRTGDVDPRLQTAPPVIATFDLLRDGSVRNVRLLQRSGIAALDFSAQRAIAEASPYPPIPPAANQDVVRVEFTFELKR